MKKLRKTLSFLLALLYTAHSGVLSYAAEANFWEARQPKKAHLTQLASAALPSGPVSPFQFDKNLPTPKPEWPAARGVSLPNSIEPFLSALPADAVRLRTLSLSPLPGKPFVFLIQDIHQNSEAQKNIARAFGRLSGASSRPLTIGVEGAVGQFNFEKFRSYSDKNLTETIADVMLEKGLIAAPSFTGVTSEKENFVMNGVEDPARYQANVKALREGSRLQPEMEKALHDFEETLKEKRKEILSPALQRFDHLRLSHENGETDLKTFTRALTRWEKDLASEDLSLELSIEQFLLAADIEESLDFKKVEKERELILSRLAPRLSEKELGTFAAHSLAFKSGKISHAQMVRALQTLLDKHGVSLAGAPAFEQYVSYVFLTEGLNGEDLLAAVTRLEKKVLTRLIRTEEERDVMEQSKWLSLAKKLISFSLTPEEWEEYRDVRRASYVVRRARKDGVILTKPQAEEGSNRVSPSQTVRSLVGLQPPRDNNNSPRPTHDARRTTHLKVFERFYEEADLRSDALTDNLLNAANGPVSVLLVGGFHTPKITEDLEARGVSYAVLQPKVTEVKENSGTQYLTVFAQDHTPLDELFTGTQLFLAPHATAMGTPAGFEAGQTFIHTAHSLTENGWDQTRTAIENELRKSHLTAPAREWWMAFLAVGPFYAISAFALATGWTVSESLGAGLIVGALTSLYARPVVESFHIKTHTQEERRQAGSVFLFYSLLALTAEGTLFYFTGSSRFPFAGALVFSLLHLIHNTISLSHPSLAPLSANSKSTRLNFFQTSLTRTYQRFLDAFEEGGFDWDRNRQTLNEQFDLTGSLHRPVRFPENQHTYVLEIELPFVLGRTLQSLLGDFDLMVRNAGHTALVAPGHRDLNQKISPDDQWTNKEHKIRYDTGSYFQTYLNSPASHHVTLIRSFQPPEGVDPELFVKKAEARLAPLFKQVDRKAALTHPQLLLTRDGTLILVWVPVHFDIAHLREEIPHRLGITLAGMNIVHSTLGRIVPRADDIPNGIQHQLYENALKFIQRANRELDSKNLSVPIRSIRFARQKATFSSSLDIKRRFTIPAKDPRPRPELNGHDTLMFPSAKRSLLRIFNGRQNQFRFIEVFDLLLSPEVERKFLRRVEESQGRLILAAEPEILRGKKILTHDSEAVEVPFGATAPSFLEIVHPEWGWSDLAQEAAYGKKIKMGPWERLFSNLDVNKTLAISIGGYIRVRLGDQLLFLREGAHDDPASWKLIPIGGAFKFTPVGREALLKLGAKKFEGEKNDTRFFIPRGKIKELEDWLNTRTGRETDPSRELKEELVDETGLFTEAEFNELFGSLEIKAATQNQKAAWIDFAGYEKHAWLVETAIARIYPVLLVLFKHGFDSIDRMTAFHLFWITNAIFILPHLYRRSLREFADNKAMWKVAAAGGVVSAALFLFPFYPRAAYLLYFLAIYPLALFHFHVDNPQQQEINAPRSDPRLGSILDTDTLTGNPDENFREILFRLGWFFSRRDGESPSGNFNQYKVTLLSRNPAGAFRAFLTERFLETIETEKELFYEGSGGLFRRIFVLGALLPIRIPIHLIGHSFHFIFTLTRFLFGKTLAIPLYRAKVILIKNTGRARPDTLYHEAIHILKNLGIIKSDIPLASVISGYFSPYQKMLNFYHLLAYEIPGNLAEEALTIQHYQRERRRWLKTLFPFHQALFSGQKPQHEEIWTYLFGRSLGTRLRFSEETLEKIRANPKIFTLSYLFFRAHLFSNEEMIDFGENFENIRLLGAAFDISNEFSLLWARPKGERAGLMAEKAALLLSRSLPEETVSEGIRKEAEDITLDLIFRLTGKKISLPEDPQKKETNFSPSVIIPLRALLKMSDSSLNTRSTAEEKDYQHPPGFSEFKKILEEDPDLPADYVTSPGRLFEFDLLTQQQDIRRDIEPRLPISKGEEEFFDFFNPWRFFRDHFKEGGLEKNLKNYAEVGVGIIFIWTAMLSGAATFNFWAAGFLGDTFSGVVLYLPFFLILYFFALADYQIMRAVNIRLHDYLISRGWRLTLPSEPEEEIILTPTTRDEVDFYQSPNKQFDVKIYPPQDKKQHRAVYARILIKDTRYHWGGFTNDKNEVITQVRFHPGKNTLTVDFNSGDTLILTQRAAPFPLVLLQRGGSTTRSYSRASAEIIAESYIGEFFSIDEAWKKIIYLYELGAAQRIAFISGQKRLNRPLSNQYILPKKNEFGYGFALNIQEDQDPEFPFETTLSEISPHRLFDLLSRGLSETLELYLDEWKEGGVVKVVVRGEEKREESPADAEGKLRYSRGVASPTGGLAARETQGLVEIIETASGKTITKWVAENLITAMAFSPDGKKFILGFEDGTFYPVDLAIPERPRHPSSQLAPLAGPIAKFDFAEGGQYLIVTLENGSQHEFTVHTLPGWGNAPEDQPFENHFEPEGGRFLVLWSQKGDEIRVQDLETKDVFQIHPENLPYFANDFMIDQTNTHFAFAMDEFVYVIFPHPTDHAIYKLDSLPSHRIQFSKDGAELHIWTEDEVKIWDYKNNDLDFGWLEDEEGPYEEEEEEEEEETEESGDHSADASPPGTDFIALSPAFMAGEEIYETPDRRIQLRAIDSAKPGDPVQLYFRIQDEDHTRYHMVGQMDSHEEEISEVLYDQKERILILTTSTDGRVIIHAAAEAFFLAEFIDNDGKRTVVFRNDSDIIKEISVGDYYSLQDLWEAVLTLAGEGAADRFAILTQKYYLDEPIQLQYRISDPDFNSKYHVAYPITIDPNWSFEEESRIVPAAFKKLIGEKLEHPLELYLDRGSDRAVAKIIVRDERDIPNSRGDLDSEARYAPPPGASLITLEPFQENKKTVYQTPDGLIEWRLSPRNWDGTQFFYFIITRGRTRYQKEGTFDSREHDIQSVRYDPGSRVLVIEATTGDKAYLSADPAQKYLLAHFDPSGKADRYLKESTYFYPDTWVGNFTDVKALWNQIVDLFEFRVASHLAVLDDPAILNEFMPNQVSHGHKNSIEINTSVPLSAPEGSLDLLAPLSKDHIHPLLQTLINQDLVGSFDLHIDSRGTMKVAKVLLNPKPDYERKEAEDDLEDFLKTGEITVKTPEGAEFQFKVLPVNGINRAFEIAAFIDGEKIGFLHLKLGRFSKSYKNAGFFSSGYPGLRGTAKHPADQRVALFVDPEISLIRGGRFQGVGRTLVGLAERLTLHHGAETLVASGVSVKNLNNFYGPLGFEEADLPLEYDAHQTVVKNLKSKPLARIEIAEGSKNQGGAQDTHLTLTKTRAKVISTLAGWFLAQKNPEKITYNWYLPRLLVSFYELNLFSSNPKNFFLLHGWKGWAALIGLFKMTFLYSSVAVALIGEVFLVARLLAGYPLWATIAGAALFALPVMISVNILVHFFLASPVIGRDNRLLLQSLQRGELTLPETEPEEIISDEIKRSDLHVKDTMKNLKKTLASELHPLSFEKLTAKNLEETLLRAEPRIFNDIQRLHSAITRETLLKDAFDNFKNHIISGTSDCGLCLITTRVLAEVLTEEFGLNVSIQKIYMDKTTREMTLEQESMSSPYPHGKDPVRTAMKHAFLKIEGLDEQEFYIDMAAGQFFMKQKGKILFGRGDAFASWMRDEVESIVEERVDIKKLNQEKWEKEFEEKKNTLIGGLLQNIDRTEQIHSLDRTELMKALAAPITVFNVGKNFEDKDPDIYDSVGDALKFQILEDKPLSDVLPAANLLLKEKEKLVLIHEVLTAPSEEKRIPRLILRFKNPRVTPLQEASRFFMERGLSHRNGDIGVIVIPAEDIAAESLDLKTLNRTYDKIRFISSEDAGALSLDALKKEFSPDGFSRAQVFIDQSAQPSLNQAMLAQLDALKEKVPTDFYLTSGLWTLMRALEVSLEDLHQLKDLSLKLFRLVQSQA